MHGKTKSKKKVIKSQIRNASRAAEEGAEPEIRLGPPMRFHLFNVKYYCFLNPHLMYTKILLNRTLHGRSVSVLKPHQGSAKKHFGLRAKMTRRRARSPRFARSSPNNTTEQHRRLQNLSKGVALPFKRATLPCEPNRGSKGKFVPILLILKSYFAHRPQIIFLIISSAKNK